MSPIPQELVILQETSIKADFAHWIWNVIFSIFLSQYFFSKLKMEIFTVWQIKKDGKDGRQTEEEDRLVAFSEIQRIDRFVIEYDKKLSGSCQKKWMYGTFWVIAEISLY